MAQTCPEGLRLGEYRILHALGEGPYTFACLAESTATAPLHHRVVVKGLKDPDLAPLFREHLRRWADYARRLEGMVKVQDLVEEAGRVYGVLTYEPGGPLAEHWEALLWEPLSRRLALWGGIARTWDELHALASGADDPAPVYATLHPHNVLVRLDDSGRVQSLVLEVPGLRAASQGSMTRTTVLTSTTMDPEHALYLAPEQVKGEAPTPASDRYAFAALAHHLLTGHPPFEAPDTEALYRKITKDEPSIPPEWAEAAAIFRRALYKDPSQRYPTCRDMLAALRPVIEQQEPARWEDTLEKLDTALQRQDPWTARRALETLRGLRPQDPKVERLAHNVEALERAAQAYATAARALDEAREKAQTLREEAPHLDPAGLRARLAPDPGLPRPGELARRWRVGLLVWLLALGLFALGSWNFARTHTTADPIFQTPAARFLGWTATPTFTPVWTIGPGTPNPPLSSTIKSANAFRLQPLRRLAGHKNFVLSIAFSPSGRLLASGSCDYKVTNSCRQGEIRLWDVKTGEVVTVLRGHDSWVRSVAFSPDGRLLASGSCGQKENTSCVQGEIRLWDVETGKTKDVFLGHESWVRSVSFSPDGRLLASGSEDNTVRLWDVRVGELVTILRGHTDFVLSVAFSPDGRLLASGSCGLRFFNSCSQGEIRLWDIETGEAVAVFRGHEKFVYSVAFSPDGRILASGSEDGTVRLWDIKIGKVVAILRGHGNGVLSVTFSPDGLLLASGSCGEMENSSCVEGEIRLWDVKTKSAVAVFREHEGWVRSVAFSPDGRLLASGSYDGTIILWAVP